MSCFQPPMFQRRQHADMGVCRTFLAGLSSCVPLLFYNFVVGTTRFVMCALHLPPRLRIWLKAEWRGRTVLRAAVVTLVHLAESWMKRPHGVTCCSSDFGSFPAFIEIKLNLLFEFQVNQPTRCNNFSSLLLDVYVQLNMFRASSLPSSGAQQLQ